MLSTLDSHPTEQLFYFIDRAQPSDVASIVVVHQDAFVHGYEYTAEPEFGATKQALQAFVGTEFATRKIAYWHDATARGTAYVARLCCNERVVGVAEAITKGAAYAELTAAYVSPEYQRRGIGSALLQTVVTGVSRPIIRLGVTRWAEAVKFYKNRGFVATGRAIAVPDPPKAYGITLEQIELELRRNTD
ncbi:MAG TPA: GNAT family N-acetyltransferase [Candidatus Saccharimonadales bacterium]|nr:GNAT family N-acetyltransferase [Candidatus Saccharimonadales bacterium]